MFGGKMEITSYLVDYHINGKIGWVIWSIFAMSLGIATKLVILEVKSQSQFLSGFEVKGWIQMQACEKSAWPK